jgi:hypothetical protein
MELLNKAQLEQVAKLLGFYKYYYLCRCGRLYGSDHTQSKIECPICESARELKKNKKK